MYLLQSNLGQVLQNVVTIPNVVEFWVPPLIHTEARNEEIQVSLQLDLYEGRRGNQVSQRALALSGTNTGALSQVVGNRNCHKTFRDGLVLLGCELPEGKPLEILGCDDLNMATELVCLDGTMKIQTDY